MKRLLCFLFGHDARGPKIIDNEPVIYECRRCLKLIYFNSKRRRVWQEYE